MHLKVGDLVQHIRWDVYGRVICKKGYFRSFILIKWFGLLYGEYNLSYEIKKNLIKIPKKDYDRVMVELL